MQKRSLTGHTAPLGIGGLVGQPSAERGSPSSKSAASLYYPSVRASRRAVEAFVDRHDLTLSQTARLLGANSGHLWRWRRRGARASAKFLTRALLLEDLCRHLQPLGMRLADIERVHWDVGDAGVFVWKDAAARKFNRIATVKRLRVQNGDTEKAPMPVWTIDQMRELALSLEENDAAEETPRTPSRDEVPMVDMFKRRGLESEGIVGAAFDEEDVAEDETPAGWY